MPYRIKSPVTGARIGRRGACLLVFGFIPFSLGGALFVQPTDRHGAPRTIPVLEMIAPAEVWSAVWMVLGGYVMVSAFLRHPAQRYGFILAYWLPLIWGAGNLASWAMGKLITGWVSALIYLGYCLLVVVVSGWEEPSATIVVPKEEADLE